MCQQVRGNDETEVVEYAGLAMVDVTDDVTVVTSLMTSLL